MPAPLGIESGLDKTFAMDFTLCANYLTERAKI